METHMEIIMDEQELINILNRKGIGLEEYEIERIYKTSLGRIRLTMRKKKNKIEKKKKKR